jgi:HlyD family secretion protein
VLERLITQQAATKDELTANDLDLAKAQSEVTRLSAVKQEFERGVKLDASRSGLQVQEAQSAVAALQEKVQDGRIVAAADGTLYSLPVKSGDYVRVGDLLGEMADLHFIRVRAFIDEPELGALEPNQPVKITWDALPNQTWIGKTEVIPKQVVARGTRSVGELLCAVGNPKLELLPNINVNVRINSKERDNVMTVPRGAVETEELHSFVFVVKPIEFSVTKSKLERREIRVGIADATNYEVLSGIRDNELIALPGDIDLHDGMSVRVINTDASSVRGRTDGN